MSERIRELQRRRRGPTSESVTVYTVILNEYDNLRNPLIDDGAKFVCFSERPRWVIPWQCQGFPQILDSPARNCRIPKCLPHLLLDCDISVYHDGAFRMHVHPVTCAELLGDADIAMFGHPGGHKSIHDEREHYLKIHGFVPHDIQQHYEKYVSEGSPDIGEFWAGGFVIRRHNAAVERFNEIWFQEYVNGSSNDQFALYAAVVRSGVKVATIDGIATLDQRFGYYLHANSGCSDNPMYEAENAKWAARVARIRELGATPKPQQSAVEN